MKWSESVKSLLTLAVCFALFFGSIILLACTKQQGDVAKDVTVRVADDVCKEVLASGADGGAQMVLDPGTATLLCDTGAGIVKVLLPRTEWRAIVARRSAVDAGPGK